MDAITVILYVDGKPKSKIVVGPGSSQQIWNCLVGIFDRPRADDIFKAADAAEYDKLQHDPS